MNDINTYAQRLLNDKDFLKESHAEYMEHDYSIPNVCGTISADNLHHIIRAAHKNKMLQDLLTDILSYADGQSITDENFRSLLGLKSKLQSTYFSVLAHLDLAFYQLQILNRYPQSYEAFSALFQMICENECFHDEDMKQLLRENNDVTTYGIRSCIDIADQKKLDNSKVKIAKEWVHGNQ